MKNEIRALLRNWLGIGGLETKVLSLESRIFSKPCESEPLSGGLESSLRKSIRECEKSIDDHVGWEYLRALIEYLNLEGFREEIPDPSVSPPPPSTIRVVKLRKRKKTK